MEFPELVGLTSDSLSVKKVLMTKKIIRTWKEREKSKENQNKGNKGKSKKERREGEKRGKRKEMQWIEKKSNEKVKKRRNK